MTRTTCPNVHLVEARRDGRLAASDVASIERHLSTCTTCAEHAADLARIGDALRVDDPTITPLEHRRARAALLRAAAAPVAPRTAPRRGVVLLVAAAVTIAGTAVAALGLPPLLRGDAEPAPSAGDPGPAPSTTVSLSPRAVVAPQPPESPPAPSPIAPATAVTPPSPSTIASPRPTSSAPSRPAPSSPASRSATTPPPTTAPPSPTSPGPAASVAARSRALHEAVEAIERGDYGQASRHLDDARAAETDPERAELATYLQAVALQRAGRLDEARAVAREYLTKHPGGRFVGEARRIADGG